MKLIAALFASTLAISVNKETYPQPDSASWIEPYNQRDHAWNTPQHDVANETHWVNGSPALGYTLNVTHPMRYEIANGTNNGGFDNAKANAKYDGTK